MLPRFLSISLLCLGCSSDSSRASCSCSWSNDGGVGVQREGSGGGDGGELVLGLEGVEEDVGELFVDTYAFNEVVGASVSGFGVVWA